MALIKKVKHRIALVLFLLRTLASDQWAVSRRLLASIEKGHFKATLSAYMYFYLKHFKALVHEFADRCIDLDGLENPRLKRLEQTVRGLHSMLPSQNDYSYSILIPVYKPKPDFFKKALLSAARQSAPNLEILVGFDGPQPDEVYRVVEDVVFAQPEYAQKIKAFRVERTSVGGGISRTTNFLATQAKNKFLLLMDHDDWIRPDLLFRYEQTLRLEKNPSNIILYCNEYKINERDEPILNSYLDKALVPSFPYLFINWICHALLVPRDTWIKVAGLRPEKDGAQDYDLCLRLDLAGAEFKNVPFYLYAWRAHSKSTAGAANQKSYASDAGARALQHYVDQKGLNWKVEPGLVPTTYRALPSSDTNLTIHALIPYKDQKALTLKAVQSLLKQKNSKIFITAIDNGSQDASIAQDLEKLGVEVLRVEAPFNYSYLNNFGAKKSKFSQKTQALLFMNNDVELESGAIEEMARWLGQPKVGLVGCRLLYPNGLLQHGGVRLDRRGPGHQMTWTHIDGGTPPQMRSFSNVINAVDAVTAACALIKREHFDMVGGFDEIWYPIAFSDTCLATKLKQKGLICLYTPFANGVHHESATRSYNNIEDFEASRWLNDKYLLRGN